MSFSGFNNADFDVFKIEGLDARMSALIDNIRPKLDYLGKHFAPTLSSLTGDEMFPHVAKHARRTINPPNDTWVAFASNSRGYKMLPHFQIGLWETHLFVWFAIIYEAPNKESFGKIFENNIDIIHNQIENDFVWSMDHTKPGVTPQSQVSKVELKSMFQRLQNVKKAELLCGYQIPREKAVVLTGDALLEKVDVVFRKLLPLYKML